MTTVTMTAMVRTSARPMEMVGHQVMPQRSRRMVTCPARNSGVTTSPIWKI